MRIEEKKNKIEKQASHTRALKQCPTSPTKKKAKLCGLSLMLLTMLKYMCANISVTIDDNENSKKMEMKIFFTSFVLYLSHQIICAEGIVLVFYFFFFCFYLHFLFLILRWPPFALMKRTFYLSSHLVNTNTH